VPAYSKGRGGEGEGKGSRGGRGRKGQRGRGGEGSPGLSRDRDGYPNHARTRMNETYVIDCSAVITCVCMV